MPGVMPAEMHTKAVRRRSAGCPRDGRLPHPRGACGAKLQGWLRGRLRGEQMDKSEHSA
jgi:hypothetical protein